MLKLGDSLFRLTDDRELVMELGGGRIRFFSPCKTICIKYFLREALAIGESFVVCDERDRFKLDVVEDGYELNGHWFDKDGMIKIYKLLKGDFNGLK